MKTFIFCSLDSDKNESQLLQNSDESELDTDEDLAWQLYEAEKEKLDIAVKHHQEVSFFLFGLFCSFKKCNLVSLKSCSCMMC